MDALVLSPPERLELSWVGTCLDNEACSGLGLASCWPASKRCPALGHLSTLQSPCALQLRLHDKGGDAIVRQHAHCLDVHAGMKGYVQHKEVLLPALLSCQRSSLSACGTGPNHDLHTCSRFSSVCLWADTTAAAFPSIEAACS